MRQQRTQRRASGYGGAAPGSWSVDCTQTDSPRRNTCENILKLQLEEVFSAFTSNCLRPSLRGEDAAEGGEFLHGMLETSAAVVRPGSTLDPAACPR